jgi:hypothetical protein
MVKQGGLGQALYVAGYDLSGDVGAINEAASPRNLLDVTAIDKSAHERINGLADGIIDFNCFFNDATAQAHDALSTLLTTDRHVLYLIGTTAGDPVAALLAKQVGYDWNRSADGALLGSVKCLGQGSPLEWGLLLVAKTTHASASDETGIDFGSQTAFGAVAYLHHFSAASGTVEYDIEDSSDSTDGDDGAWANLGAFNDVATPWAQIAQRLEITGTVERWVRASTNGTFTTAVFAMAFRRGTAQDDVDLS